MIYLIDYEDYDFLDCFVPRNDVKRETKSPAVIASGAKQSPCSLQGIPHCVRNDDGALFAGDSCFRRNDEVGKWNNEAGAKKKSCSSFNPENPDSDKYSKKIIVFISIT